MNWLSLIPALFRAGSDIQTKGWYASRTIWFNLLVLAFDISLKGFGHELPLTGEDIDSMAMALAALGNIGLRVITDKPLGLRTERPPADRTDPQP